MKRHSGVVAFLLRFLPLGVIYIAALAILGLVPVWATFDTAIAGALVRRHAPALDSRIVTIDLRVDDDHSWSAVTSFLRTVRSSIDHRHVVPPAAIVLDVTFRNDHRENGATPKGVADAIRSVRDAGTAVFVAVDPYNPGSTQYRPRFMDALVPGIYDEAATGVGHTEWFATQATGGSIFWYHAAIPERPGNEVFALPLVATNDMREDVRADFPFPVGDHAAFLRSLKTTHDVRADPTFLSGNYIVVGSTTGSDFNFGLDGIETVAWALSDRMTLGQPGHLALFTDRNMVFALTLSCTLLVVGLFMIGFQLTRSYRWGLPAATATAAILPTVALVAAVEVLAMRDVIYLQPTFEFAAVLVTVALCWRAGRQQIVRDAVLASLSETNVRIAQRYDVFVSYSRDEENARWVEENVVTPLRGARNARGEPLSVFFDQEKIHLGMGWYEEIVAALWASRFVIPIYTPRYFERHMCMEELSTAMRRHAEDPSFTILPVTRMGANIPPEFTGIQYLDAVENPNFIHDVIKTVGGIAGVPARVDALLELPATSTPAPEMLTG